MAVKLGFSNIYRDPHGFPKWQQQGLPVESALEELPMSLSPPVTSAAGPPLRGFALLWTLLTVFAGGVALNLTPCVYPMIPITVSFFGGRSAREKQSQAALVFHGLLYLLGLALTNSILGVVAALTGSLMGALLQNPMVLLGVAGLLVVFASSLFGFWELRLPGFLIQVAGKSYSGYFGSLFMGITLGIVAAPCLGPFVLGLLTWVAGRGSAGLGFLVFFTLSLGLGLPLFVLALFSGQLQRLPRAGGWMIWVRKLMGWILVGMAAYFIRPILPENWKVILLAAVALAAGLHLGWLEKSETGLRTFRRMRIFTGTLGLVLSTLWVTSWAMQAPGITWKPFSEEVLQQASRQNKPVILDFYADWCTPCRELEKVTFHHPDVVKLAGKKFVMVKVDVTQSGNPAHDALLKHYAVKGVPTLVFLDARGKERTDLRAVDFLPPETMLIRMSELEPNAFQ